MDSELIKSLVQQGEALGVEFKSESHKPLNDRELAKTIVCLANRRERGPAWLLVGVEDDGTISGARPRHGDHTEPAKVIAAVASRTNPSVAVEVHSVQVEGKIVLAIQIPPVRNVVGTSDGTFLMREIGHDGKPTCRPMSRADMDSLQGDHGHSDYTSEIVQTATWDDLDPREFDRFRGVVRDYSPTSDTALLELSNLDLAKALGVVNANGDPREIRVAALLLFGTEDALAGTIPNHSVAFQFQRGDDLEVNDFFRGPLLRVLEECQRRMDARKAERELMVGFIRVGVPNYTRRSLREALINAMTHRDYLRLGAIHFQWYDDKIRVSNPGGFLVGTRLDGLIGINPRSRNLLLANVFKRAGIVEKRGHGIDMIFKDHVHIGRAVPSYAKSTDHSVILEFPGGEPNLNFVQVIAEKEHSGRKFSLADLLALNRLWSSGGASTSDIARAIQETETDAVNVLALLEKDGLVGSQNKGQSTRWSLSEAILRRLYPTVRPITDDEIGEMVLRHVDRHDRITRNGVAKLCGIESTRARRVLARLVKAGRLVVRGTRRWAFYERGDED